MRLAGIAFDTGDNALLHTANPTEATHLADSRVAATSNSATTSKSSNSPLCENRSPAADLRQLRRANNDRHFAFTAFLYNPGAAHKAMTKLAAAAKGKGRSPHGFDLVLDPDYRLFLTPRRGA